MGGGLFLQLLTFLIDNFIYYKMRPTEYDAVILLGKKSYFSGVVHSGIKIRIFGTKLLLL